MFSKPEAKSATRKRLNNPTNAKVKAQLELRARWIIREWERSPTYSYGEMLAAVRERYQCGEGTAEAAYARARQLLAAAVTEIDLGRIIQLYERIIEDALSNGKHNAATRALNSMALVTGHVKPITQKHEHVHSRTDENRVAHVTILQLTPIERKHRKTELLVKAGLDPERAKQLMPAQLDDVVAAALNRIEADDRGEDVPPASEPPDYGDPDDDGDDEMSVGRVLDVEG